MKKIQQGFTLIELMIVVAIIGILAAVAIPQYQDYITRSKLVKVSTSVDAVKTAIAEYLQNTGGDPSGLAGNDWTTLGLPSAGPTATAEVSGITVTAATGAIVATIQGVGAGFNGGTVTWTPPTAANAGTALVWTVSCASNAGSASQKALMAKVFAPASGTCS
ncbi:MAG TPA: pilin [Rhodocyclaceae bacterium]